jgi:hypothetical protein
MSTPIPAPAEDDALDALFQQAVTSITSLPGEWVRPRWQPTEPKQPDSTQNWCAIGVFLATPSAGPGITHIAGDESATPPTADCDQVVRYETLEVLASFYGPNAKQYASMLRDGLSLPQNMEALEANLIGYQSTGPIRQASELVNQVWVRRQDMMLVFYRKVIRQYAVDSIVAANINIVDDSGPPPQVDREVEVPPS